MSANTSSSGMPVWRVSLTCEGGGCVGVARQGDSIWIGNTTSPEAPVSKFTFEEWDHFVAGIKLGHFDDLK